MLNSFLIYFGTVTLVLFFLYGTMNYTISLIVGFIAFCVFYLDYKVVNFEWTFSSLFPHLKDAGIIYIISFAIGVLIYRLLPLKQPLNVTAQ